MDEDLIEQAWRKGDIAASHDPAKARKDECGAWIVRSEYGNHESKFGWEIDRRGLRPVQWENNVSDGAGRLICVVTSDGGANVNIQRE